MKRLFDLTLVILSLPVSLPLLALLALAARVSLGSPVLFQQIRPGRHGQPFTIYNFRTMTDRRDSSGELLPDADRLTGFGRFLRSTSLDELPELINVVKGEMSLVGPRPLLMEYLERYSPEQARRALAAGPAYLGVGPVYATGTKPDAKPVTLDYVRWAVANLQLPWFAIGGINLENLPAVLAAGARRICVVSAILNSDDLAATCRKFKAQLDQAHLTR